MARLDHIVDLRVFEALARLGSLTAAAADLGITLAVASKRLQRLEAVLGLRLADRTTRSVRLTQDGMRMLVQCRQTLQAVDRVEDVAQRGAEGVVRIAAAVAFAQRQLAPLVPDFLESYPDIHLEIASSNRVADLVEEGVDVAFRQSEPMNAHRTVRARLPDRHLLVASPDYLNRRGVPEGPEDLTRHRLLCVGLPAPREWLMHRGCERRDVPILNPMSASDGEVVHAVALNSGGIALKSIWDVAEDLRAGRLVQVLPDWKFDRREVHILVPMRDFQSRRVTLAVQFLKTALERKAADLGLAHTP